MLCNNFTKYSKWYKHKKKFEILIFWKTVEQRARCKVAVSLYASLCLKYSKNGLKTERLKSKIDFFDDTKFLPNFDIFVVLITKIIKYLTATIPQLRVDKLYLMHIFNGHARFSFLLTNAQFTLHII